MDYRILGPLEVLAPDGPVPLGAAKQRVVLAVLLLHANEVVSTDRLIEAVWGSRPPRTAVPALQGYIAVIRKLVARQEADDEAALLVTRQPGYMLRLSPDQLDVWQFEGLAEEG